MPSARVEVLVSPGARRNAIERTPDGIVRVRVTAPPVEGKANLAVVGLLAEALHIPRSCISILHGGSGRRKLVVVDGLNAEDVHARLTG